VTAAAEPSLRISEIFTSIQGEGPSVGTPSVFVRLQGCAVGCAWCDTKYAWDARHGDAMTLEAVLGRVKEATTANVVVTGGEPLEHPGFVPLVLGIKALGLRVEVESAGTEMPPPVPVDQWNVSPKLAHSGVPAARRLRSEAIERFRDLGAWFKFVVGDERDLDEVLTIQARHGLPAERILLMPLGMHRREQEALMPDVIEWCRRHGFRFSPRLHILVWGPRRRV
jgi:organic radical activating enzyme